MMLKELLARRKDAKIEAFKVSQVLK